MKLNLSIRTKLLGGFGLLLLLTAVFGIVAVQQVAKLDNTLTLTQGKEGLLARADASLWEIRYNAPQFQVLEDVERRKKILSAEPRLHAAVDEFLKQFRAAPGLSDEEISGHQVLTEAFGKYKEARLVLFSLFAADKDKTEEAADWRAKNTTPRGAATAKAMHELLDVTARNDAARREAQQKSTSRALTMLAVLGLAAVLFGVAAAFFTFRSINGPLGKLQEMIRKLSAGDLEARARLTNRDELGLLGDSFDKLLDDRIAAQREAEGQNERLNNSVISILQSVNQLSQRDLTARAPVTQDIIGTVSDSINALTDETAKVLNGVSRIAGQVADASGKVQTQAALVSKTAEDERVSVGQMIEALANSTQTMNQVAALAEQSNVSAGQATQATDTALETVNGTVKGMESIRETIAETEKRIKRLGERSQEISGIVTLINTISERTHVLALNASMQAAVAGEAGRGFAVVAEEVQRLAESSRTATQQIATLVNNIQLETNETISTVNRTIGQVVHGSEQAQKAGDQMRRTQEITGQLVAHVKRIGEASNQQKEMSADLLTSVQRIGVSTQRTADQITAQNHETDSLLQSARRLVESVNVFKLPQAA